MLASLRRWATHVRRDTYAVGLMARDPRVPWYAKVLALAVAGYALSPVDLIPDFIPVIGLVDDAILVPLGIVLVLKMVPEEVLREHRARAQQAIELPKNRAATAVILCVWFAVLAFSAGLAWKYL